MKHPTLRRLLSAIRAIPDKLKTKRAAAAPSGSAPQTEPPASDRTTVILLILRAVLVVAALIVSSLRSVDAVAALLIRIAAYLIIGYDTLWTGLQKLMAGKYINRCLVLTFVGLGAFFLEFETGAILMMLFFRIWEVIADIAARDGRKTVLASMDPRPEQMSLLLGGMSHVVDASRIAPGDTLLIPTGGRTAVDCVILSGSGEAELSCTGDPEFRAAVAPGDSLPGGARNLGEPLTVQALRTRDDSAPALLLSAMEVSAEGSEAFAERLSRITKLFTVICAAAAFVIGVVLPLIFDLPFAPNLKCGLLLLLISCPHVFLDTVPFTVFAGISGAAKHGVLIRNAKHLNTLSSVTTVVADEKGALSKGDYRLAEATALAGDKDTLLSLAGSVSQGSGMPLLKQLTQYAAPGAERSIRKRAEFPGLGVTATFHDNIVVTVGHGALLSELGIAEDAEDRDLLLYVAIGDRIVGTLRFEVSPNEKAALLRQQLRNAGISRFVLFTDASRADAQLLAEKLGVSEYYAECSPGKKAEKLRDLQAMQIRGEHLAYIGEGYGDSAVLREASIGISTDPDLRRKGSAASVQLLSGDLKSAADSLVLSRDVMRYLRQNFYLPLFGKIALILLALLGWAPFWLPPLADAVFHFSALLNGMQAFDPVTYHPAISKRAGSAARRLFGAADQDAESRRSENEQEAELLRRRRAETKALLFHPRNR